MLKWSPGKFKKKPSSAVNISFTVSTEYYFILDAISQWLEICSVDVSWHYKTACQMSLNNGLRLDTKRQNVDLLFSIQLLPKFESHLLCKL